MDGVRVDSLFIFMFVLEDLKQIRKIPKISRFLLKFWSVSEEVRSLYKDPPYWVTTHDLAQRMDGLERALNEHNIRISKQDAYQLVCLLKGALLELESPYNPGWTCRVQPSLYMTALDLSGYPRVK